MENQKKELRIFNYAGPGDVLGTFRCWAQGKHDQREVSDTFSGQFYEVCSKLKIKAYVLSSSIKSDKFSNEQFIIENKAVPFSGSCNAILYYCGQFIYAAGLFIRVLKFRANIAFIQNGAVGWFMLYPLILSGVKVIPVFHNMPLPVTRKINFSKRLVLNLSRDFLKNRAYAIMSVSKIITEQIDELAGKKLDKYVMFTYTYKSEYFSDIPDSDVLKSPFRVFFAGRVEEDKGVFDLLEVARSIIIDRKIEDVVFDVCGDGFKLDLLKEKVRQLNLNAYFNFYGQCSQEAMKQKMRAAHIFIVPTRSSFLEGFNRVVIEGVLSRRPTITSRVTGADILNEAIIEVPPDDVKGYVDAVLKLYSDPDFYKKKAQACGKYSEIFFNRENSFEAALEKVLITCKSDK